MCASFVSSAAGAAKDTMHPTTPAARGGLLITLEGPDGSGKTTQFRRLHAWLGEAGHDVLALREPGATALGEAVRALLLHHRADGVMDARAEVLLFCASRAQLVSERILPHLETGGTVLCDRFSDSTLAYQGYGRGLDLDTLRMLLHFATRGLRPDVTLYFDIDAQTGLSRRSAEGGINRLDAEPLAYHDRVRSGYLSLCREDPDRWEIIDATKPADQVFVTVLDKLQTRIKQK